MDDVSKTKCLCTSSKTQKVLSIGTGGLLPSEVNLFPRCEAAEEEEEDEDEKADLDDEPFFDMIALGLNDLPELSRPPP